MRNTPCAAAGDAIERDRKHSLCRRITAMAAANEVYITARRRYMGRSGTRNGKDGSSLWKMDKIMLCQGDKLAFGPKKDAKSPLLSLSLA